MPPVLARSVLALTAACFAAFFLWPLAQILRGGFVDADGHFTLAYLGAILSDARQMEALGNSFLLACASTLLGGFIAVPLAVVSDRCLFPGRTALNSLILVPLILPPFVGAIGIKQIFGQYGAGNAVLHHLGLLAPDTTIDWFAASRFWGVALVQALSLYPIIYLNTAAALANLDPTLDEAAQNLGCTGWRRFRRVTLPLIRPGLFAGGTIVFIWSFTELGTPLVFDFDRVTSVQIYNGLKDIGANPLPFALVTVMLASSVGLYAASKCFFGRSSHAMMAKATSSGGPRPLPGWRGWAATALFVAVTFAAVLPHFGVVLIALARDWYGTVLPNSLTLENFRLALGHDLTVPAIANSLRCAGLATVIDLALGVAIAWVVVRSRVQGRQALDFLAMLPLAVPGLVLAFGYLAMTQEGRLFAALNPARDPTLLLVIAYSVRRLPYVVRAAVAGFEQTSVTLEEAAQNLGCPPVRTLFRVTLPSSPPTSLPEDCWRLRSRCWR
jgi:iron(III) transport system permease protein